MEKDKVISALEKAVEQGKGLEYFGVLGLKECIDTTSVLDDLGATYFKVPVKEDGDVTPYDIFVDVLSYKAIK